MPRKVKLTLRAQWLGKMLKELREDNGMTLKEVAEYLRRDLSALSRFESGIYPLRRDDVVDLMDLYGVNGDHQRTAMLQLVEEISKTGWWDKYAKDVWGSTIDYLWLENRAERLTIFSPLVVPGVLQTRGYMEKIIRIASPGASAQQVERWIGIRVARQEILTREVPTTVRLILDEAALRRPVGGSQVMAEQLQILLATTKKLDVEIRVLPFNAGEYDGPNGSFILVKMADPFPEVVYTETAAGEIFLEAGHVETFSNLYDRMSDKCLNPGDSVEFIQSIERELT